MVLTTGYSFFKSGYSFVPNETAQPPCEAENGTRYDYIHGSEIDRVTYKERPSFLRIDHL